MVRFKTSRQYLHLTVWFLFQINNLIKTTDKNFTNSKINNKEICRTIHNYHKDNPIIQK